MSNDNNYARDYLKAAVVVGVLIIAGGSILRAVNAVGTLIIAIFLIWLIFSFIDGKI
jgi:hypothetical protein